ncbi:hypothetical protein VN12_03945 [Pirellula sp. SH-Sr6A]|nr:hypothetical protein VN12_03945 [Pirellula sp. SH-Sr6A]
MPSSLDVSDPFRSLSRVATGRSRSNVEFQTIVCYVEHVIDNLWLRDQSISGIGWQQNTNRR